MFKYIFIFILSCTFCFAQKTECLVKFKDEKKQKGFANITVDGTIEFSKTPDGKTEILDANNVVKLIIYKEKPEIYEYYKISKEGNLILLKILTGNGVYFGNEVVLYAKAKEVNTSKKQTPTYYLKKRFDEEFLIITPELNPRQWKRKMLTYFKDCSPLVETLRFGGYSKKSMPEMIKEYNTLCR